MDRCVDIEFVERTLNGPFSHALNMIPEYRALNGVAAASLCGRPDEDIIRLGEKYRAELLAKRIIDGEALFTKTLEHILKGPK